MTFPQPSRQLIVSPCAEQRLRRAAAFLRALPPAHPALLLAQTQSAIPWLCQRALRPGATRAGWVRHTLDTLASELALPGLAAEGRAPLTALGVRAACAAALDRAAKQQALGRYRAIAAQPGFAQTLCKTLVELRLAGLSSAAVRAHDLDLGNLLAAYEEVLDAHALTDSAGVLRAATARLQAGRHRYLGAALLSLDVGLVHRLQADFVRALCEDRPQACITVVQADERSEGYFRLAFADALHVERPGPAGSSELDRLKRRLFSGPSTAPDAPCEGRGVRIVSSPGESREAAEVARGILEEAQRVPLDRIALALRAIEPYRGVVEEVLWRAGIPAHFAEGVARPWPEGRALLCLLECARDDLSAAAFATYLSLAVTPAPQSGDDAADLVTPRRWERMIEEASVIGGRERWTRRLAALGELWRQEAARLPEDDPRRARRLRDARGLAALERFAQPLLDQLDALRTPRIWGDVLARLSALARAALAKPDGVCDVLASLAPLAAAGPVGIDEVQRVLSERLGHLVVPSSGLHAGKVFVGAVDDLRGRAFDRVFVLGLSEQVFPPRVVEDPLLPDRLRRALSADLLLTDERVTRERLALRIAVGAATQALTLSFSRLDAEHGRPRVPSFYGLEVLQAIDGVLPAFDELTRRADPGAAARMGWPAPAAPERAIDDSEFDLAMLERVLAEDAESQEGALRYLLIASPHLARSLRFRARRWALGRFSPADGLLCGAAAREAFRAAHGLSQRAYSASSLAQLARCPYRFYLHAIAGVSGHPTEDSGEDLSQRQRGLLFHQAQQQLLASLKQQRRLPLSRADLPAAQDELRRIFRALALRTKDDVAPVVERVFDASLAALEADLQGWLARMADGQDWEPQHFELGFGVRASVPGLDPDSASEPVALEGLRLAGVIDLVEARWAPDGTRTLRATDHKTGLPSEPLGISSKGRVLQPLLYALALERLFPEARVQGGRLYFCTQQAGFAEHEVALDDSARAVYRQWIDATASLLDQGFLPAAPDKGECAGCAYRPVCGPYEEERVAQVKARDVARLGPLFRVRNLP